MPPAQPYNYARPHSDPPPPYSVSPATSVGLHVEGARPLQPRIPPQPNQGISPNANPDDEGEHNSPQEHGGDPLSAGPSLPAYGVEHESVSLSYTRPPNYIAELPYDGLGKVLFLLGFGEPIPLFSPIASSTLQSSISPGMVGKHGSPLHAYRAEY